MPTVSIIIPCFNGQDFVGGAIRSALRQSFKNIEVIVVDDGSADDSRSVIVAAAEEDARVVPLFLGRNSGPSAARNRALAVARGKWIALLDADDLYHKDRISRLLELAEARNADIVADNQSVHHFGSATRLSSAFRYLDAGEVVEVDRSFFFDHIWEGPGNYSLGLLKPLFRKEFLDVHSIRYDERYSIGEDFRFYLSCVLRGARFFMTGTEYYIYHIRPGSISRLGTRSMRILAGMCDEILKAEQRLLDDNARKKLAGRRSGLLRVVSWREIRDLRLQHNWAGLAGYALRKPVAAYDLAKMSLAWRRQNFMGRG